MLARFSLIATLIASLLLAPAVRASTVDDLKQQKAALDQAAIDAQQRAEMEKSVAQRAQDKIAQVSGQIDQLQNDIQSTGQQLQDTQTQIDQKNQEVAGLQSDLSALDRKKSIFLRELYMASVSQPDDLALFSNQSISTQQKQEAEFSALKKSVALLQIKTLSAKNKVEESRNQLVKKSEDLQHLKTQQDEQQRGLADAKLENAQLADNALAAVQDQEQKAQQARIQAGQVEHSIEVQLEAILAARTRSGVLGAKVGVGKWVHQGDYVGNEGSTGFSTGPHVHFEVRANGVPVNPAPYVSNGTLIWPISNFVISQGFGYTSFAAQGAYGGSIHTGIDLAGPYGAPVFAPADGEVILDSWYGAYGKAWAEQLQNGLVVLLGHMIQ